MSELSTGAGIAELTSTIPAVPAPAMRWPLVKLLRPKQWIKNGFVLAPLVFAGAIVFYSLFTMTVRPALAYTVPCVLFGLFRYWFLVERGDGESPTDVVWTDVPLGLTVAPWAGLCVFSLMPR